MDTKAKIFAFELAEKNEKASTSSGWRARDGVSVAGCTQLDDRGPRANVFYGGWPAPPDEGYWC